MKPPRPHEPLAQPHRHLRQDNHPQRRHRYVVARLYRRWEVLRQTHRPPRQIRERPQRQPPHRESAAADQRIQDNRRQQCPFEARRNVLPAVPLIDPFQPFPRRLPVGRNLGPRGRTGILRGPVEAERRLVVQNVQRDRLRREHDEEASGERHTTQNHPAFALPELDRKPIEEEEWQQNQRRRLGEIAQTDKQPGECQPKQRPPRPNPPPAPARRRKMQTAPAQRTRPASCPGETHVL